MARVVGMRLPLSLFVVFLCLIFSACEKKSDGLTMDDVNDLGDKSQDKAEDLGDATQDSYENYKDAVQN